MNNTPRDVRRHIASFLEYPDRVNLDTCSHAADVCTRRDAFEFAKSQVHRPWLLTGRCVVAGCRRLKHTISIDWEESLYTLSNYCTAHSSGRRATHIQQAYIMQPPSN